MPNWKDEAHNSVQKMIVESEQFRVTLETPKGNPSSSVTYSDHMDDEFFHITCHVEDSLCQKIEKSAYVDLEKLLVKDR